MKKVVLAISIIIVLVGAGIGFMRYQNHQSYQHDLQVAKRAVQARDWQAAKRAYEAAQAEEQTPLTYTALRQLTHIIPAQADYNHEDWDGAVSQFKLGLAIDDGLPVIKEAVQPLLTKAKEKQTAAREASQASLQAAKASSLARDESRRAQSRASEASSRQAAEKAKSERHESDTAPSNKEDEHQSDASKPHA